MSSPSSPDPEIPDPLEHSLAAAREGSLSAMGQLLEFYRGYLLATANELVDREVAQKMSPSDIVQETLFEAMRGLPNFQGSSEAEIRAWLRRILLNNLQDAQRRFKQSARREVSREVPLELGTKGAHDPGNPNPSGLDPVKVAIADEELQRLRDALARLSEDHRQVIQMRTFEGQSLDEIAQRLGRSSEAVRKLWSRAVEKLAGELQSDDRRSP